MAYPRTATVLFACIAPLAACRQLPAPTASEEPPAPGPYASVEAALAADDLDAARAAIDALQLEAELERATAILGDGDPRDALVHVDRALELAPGDARALTLKAHGATAVADQLIADGAGAVYVEGALFDALAAWRQLEPTPHNRVAASEVAWRLSNWDLAGELARGAHDALLADPALAADLAFAERVQRAWAEASFSRFVANVQASGGDQSAQFLEAEDAVLGAIGFAPDDAQLRTRLVDLYLWRGDTPSALEAGRAAVERLPGDRVLLDRLVLAGATVDELETLDQGDPLTKFFTGRARLGRALELRGADAERAFDAARTAARELREAAEADATLADEVLGWRAIARTTQGWAQYDLGELDKARGLFESTEKLFAGASEWLIEGQVRSAVDGLYFTGDQYRQAGAWEDAARTFQTLERLQPAFANWANNAGFFARDAAVELEAEGRDLCALSRGELEDDRRAEELRALAGVADDADEQVARELLLLESNARFDRARALAEESYASYLHASELAPTDVRIVNDTALIQVYYLHDKLDLAEEFLVRAIEMGAEQLAAADDMDEDALFALTEAYGDALQNLGVLRLMLLDDAQGAIPLLEQSAEVGPLPRPLITNALLPYCRGELDVALEDVMPEVNWCTPCTPIR